MFSKFNLNDQFLFLKFILKKKNVVLMKFEIFTNESSHCKNEKRNIEERCNNIE